jgi:hypothetical protein
MPPDSSVAAPVRPRIWRRWRGKAFLAFSAIVHLAAAVALSVSWSGRTAESSAPATAAVAPAVVPASTPQVARLAIDVAPPKYCDMKIEEIIGRPRDAEAGAREVPKASEKPAEEKRTVEPTGIASVADPPPAAPYKLILRGPAQGPEKAAPSARAPSAQAARESGRAKMK